ncbi:MAG: DegV family protein [Desulfobacterales bacterium]|nr:DegV family protein [Desulfobacterales bacterium]
MARKIGIVTDSTADVPQHFQHALGITVVPVSIIIDGQRFRDGVDMQVQDFYRNFSQYGEMYSEPVSYEDYALAYKKLTYEYDDLICIHCSSKVSATYQNAVDVHNDFNSSHDCRVAIVDSMQCSMGVGIPVMAAARMAQTGKDFDTIVAQIDLMRGNMSTFFGVTNLKHLRKGKKISGLKSLVGMAMKVKPVLSFEDGQIMVKTKLFGEQQHMILEMIDMIREDIGGRPITLAIMQTAADAAIIQRLRSVFESEFDCKDVFDAYVSPSIGLNTGPDSTGVIYYKHPMGA